MKIIWYGTASLEIISGEDHILIDPYLPLKGAQNPGYLPDYLDLDTILITHGHMDHLSTVPKIMSLNPNASVFCTQSPAATLEKKGVDPDRIGIIAPGHTLTFGGIRVTPLKGRHSVPDKSLKKETLINPRILQYAYNLPKLALQTLFYKEEGETLCYLIETEQKKILLMGSLSMDPETEYPLYPDLMILPYQGISNPEMQAIAMIEAIHPRNLMLIHFDDAFPPISKTISTKPLYRLLTASYPDLPVVKPTAGKAVTLI